MTPCAIRNFGLQIGHRSTFPTKILSSSDNSKGITEAAAAEEVIAVPLRIYHDFTDEQLDLILSNYFSKCAKNVSFDNATGKTLIEIHQEVLPPNLHCCFPDSFHFELQLVKPAQKFSWEMFKISSRTRLSRYSPIRRWQQLLPPPPVLKIHNRKLIIDVFPEFLLEKARQIQKTLDGCGGKTLLLYGHSGNGKEDLVQAVSNLTGLGLRKYDCRPDLCLIVN